MVVLLDFKKCLRIAVAKAYKDSELSGREYKRLVNYVQSILQDEKGGEKC